MVYRGLDAALVEHIKHDMTCIPVKDPVTDIIDCTVLMCNTCNKAVYSCDIEDDDGSKAVWVLKIISDIGSEIFHFSNEEVALDQLFNYVKDRWEDEFPDEHMPVEKQKAVDYYFFDNARAAYIMYEQPIFDEVEY